MERAPTIDEVQAAINGFWKTAGISAAPPPQVLQTLLFFQDGADITPYAVVSANGGHAFNIGNWVVSTVSQQAPSSKALMACRIGECPPVPAQKGRNGNGGMLLLTRNGGKAPSIEACRAAENLQDRIRDHSRRLFTEVTEMGHLLSRQHDALTHDLANFVRFAEMARAVDLAQSELRAVETLLADLFHLRSLPEERTIDALAACIDHEAELLQSLQEAAQERITGQTETFDAHRRYYEDLERLRRQDEAYQRQQRADIEALYHEALRHPHAITHSDAAEELREIAEMADDGQIDEFILRRRLYILRLRCRHSITLPAGDYALRTLLTDIEEEIHRLRR